MPSASDHARHGRSRPHGHAVTGRARHAGLGIDEIGAASSCRRARLRSSPDVGAGSDLLAAEVAIEHGAAGDARWPVNRSWPRPSCSDGVVLSQPQSSTTPSIGLPRIDSSTSMLTRLRNSMAVGRSIGLAQRHHGKLQREAARFVHAALDPLGNLRGNARCTGSAPTRYCKCRSPAGHRTGWKETPGSSSTNDG